VKGLLFAAALLTVSSVMAANSYETELSATGVKTLHIEWANGDVELIADDAADIRVNARGGSSDWLDYAEFSVEGSEALAVFDTRGRAGGIYSDITLRFPRGLNVEVSAGNGDVTVSGGSGVDIDAGNGNVYVSGVAGRTVIDAGNGNVELQVPKNYSSSVDLDAGNGNVEAEIESGFSGKVDITDGNGNVEVTFASVPSGLGIDASSGMGSVSTDLPGAKVTEGLMGSSISRSGNACSLNVTTGMGNIEILAD
jgi:DUF4097 and DUF4098 domain-containing protein YvlB